MLLVNCGTELAQLVGCDLAQSGHRLLLPGIISDELCCFVDRRGNRPLRIFVPAEVNVAPAKQVTALTAFHALHESQHLSNLILHGERMAHPLLLRVQAFDEPHGGGAQHCRQYGCKPNASDQHTQRFRIGGRHGTSESTEPGLVVCTRPGDVGHKVVTRSLGESSPRRQQPGLPDCRVAAAPHSARKSTKMDSRQDAGQASKRRSHRLQRVRRCFRRGHLGEWGQWPCGNIGGTGTG
jgi:hypothetical protein